MKVYTFIKKFEEKILDLCSGEKETKMLKQIIYPYQ